VLTTVPELEKAVVLSVCTKATPPNEADTVTGGDACALAGFTSGIPNTSTVSPDMELAMTALLCDVMVTTNPPVDLVH